MGKFHWKLRFTVLVLMVKSGYGLASRAELSNSSNPYSAYFLGQEKSIENTVLGSFHLSNSILFVSAKSPAVSR